MAKDFKLLQKIKDAAFLEGDFVTRAGKKTNYYVDKYLLVYCFHLCFYGSTVP